MPGQRPALKSPVVMQPYCSGLAAPKQVAELRKCWMPADEGREVAAIEAAFLESLHGTRELEAQKALAEVSCRAVK